MRSHQQYFEPVKLSSLGTVQFHMSTDAALEMFPHSVKTYDLLVPRHVTSSRRKSSVGSGLNAESLYFSLDFGLQRFSSLAPQDEILNFVLRERHS